MKSIERTSTHTLVEIPGRYTTMNEKFNEKGDPYRKD